MQPAREPPRTPSQSPGTTDRGNDRHTGQNSGRIHLEQSFEGARLNTGIVSDLQTLARHLLANFRTIRLPAEALPVRPNLEPTDWWAVAKARRAEKRVLYDLRDGIRRVLNTIAIH